DFEELQNRLLPLLSRQTLTDITDKQQWAENMLSEVHDKISTLLPLRENEINFLDALLKFGEIKPEFLTDSTDFQEKVKLHPAVRWTAYNVQRSS
ncbi:MAG: hypothetical protein KAT71_04335, partial [Gammaproteobacteria bacterium]|nr:hypothetical protein [Gammaproteobacteria bacterium]